MTARGAGASISPGVPSTRPEWTMTSSVQQSAHVKQPRHGLGDQQHLVHAHPLRSKVMMTSSVLYAGEMCNRNEWCGLQHTRSPHVDFSLAVSTCGPSRPSNLTSKMFCCSQQPPVSASAHRIFWFTSTLLAVPRNAESAPSPVSGCATGATGMTTWMTCPGAAPDGTATCAGPIGPCTATTLPTLAPSGTVTATGWTCTTWATGTGCSEAMLAEFGSGFG
mmetsp:Transcript_20104/g.80192  ORF Transcript_20104/g.80192 Transcript_20104/m.80192 type:complete len:221 (+) Transcript_20104:965-1627(+)